MVSIFSERIRRDVDFAKENENSFNYYDRSARPEMTAIRNMLDWWFQRYPTSEQAELKSRFKKTFADAFYELFLHELFLRQGFQITCHPILSHTERRPDFLIAKGDFECYIEAKVASGKTESEVSLERKINTFYDNFNKIKSNNFSLWIEKLEIKSFHQPSTKKILKYIEQELNSLDPDEHEKQIKLKGLRMVKSITYTDRDVEIELRLIPKLKKYRDDDSGRAIGAYPLSFVIGSQDSIKDSISKKSNRYGKLEKPYIICINAVSVLGDADFDVSNALWGSLAITMDNKTVRSRDGIFLDHKGARIKHVTGVFVTKVFEYNLNSALHWLAKHPFSENTANFDVFDLSYLYVADNQIKLSDGKSIAELFEDCWSAPAPVFIPL